MAALTAGAVRVLQARCWDHRLTDHAIIISCIHEGACRRHTMWGTANTCSSVRVKCVCDTTCTGRWRRAQRAAAVSAAGVVCCKASAD